MDMWAGITSGKQQFIVKLLVLFFLCCFIPPAVFGEENFYQSSIAKLESGQYVISSIPVIIESPGDYLLNTSITLNKTAITIYSSDVTLDGQGNFINGNDTLGSIGIDINGSYAGIQNILIRNITIQDFDTGIRADMASECQIDEVILDSNLRAGFQCTNSTAFLFSQSEIQNNYNDITGGYGILVANSVDINFQDLLLTGNGKISKSNSGGFFLTNSSECNIERSEVSSNPGSGIRSISGTDNISVKDCDISGNSGNGIIISDSINPVISDCILKNNEDSALEVTSIDHPTITGNRISSSTIGISITDTLQMILSGNKLTDNRIGFDISASNMTYLLHQIDNTNTIDSRVLLYLNEEKNRNIGLKENPAMIIAVRCSDITISDLVLSKNGVGVFLAGCQNISLHDISCMDNGIGIRTGFNTEGVTISKLYAERNLVCGYYFSDTQKFTLSNIYGQDSPLGLFIKNSNNGRIEKASMTWITGLKTRMPSGLTISNSSHITVDKSVFSHCTYAGLISDTKDFILTNNSFLQNEYAGSLILSGPVKIRDNSFIQNEDTGIIFRGNDSILADNSIKDNENRGILMVNSDGNLITHNIFNNTNNIAMTGNNSNNDWNSSPEREEDVHDNGGNYWGNPDNQGYSDLCFADSSGLCSDAYFINNKNIDYEPLSANYTCFSTLQISDMNENGRLDLQDVVVFMKKISFGLNESSYDFSGDGRVNLQDVVVLFQTIRQ